MVGADTAGQVGPGRYHLLPQSLCRLEQRLITELCIQVGNASQQIELAHGMTGHGGGFTYRGVVLPVLGTESTRSEQPMASLVDEVLGCVQVGGLAGFSVALDQRRLDLWVAVDPVDLILPGTEGAHDEIREAPRHV